MSLRWAWRGKMWQSKLLFNCHMHQEECCTDLTVFTHLLEWKSVFLVSVNESTWRVKFTFMSHWIHYSRPSRAVVPMTLSSARQRDRSHRSVWCKSSFAWARDIASRARGDQLLPQETAEDTAQETRSNVNTHEKKREAANTKCISNLWHKEIQVSRKKKEDVLYHKLTCTPREQMPSREKKMRMKLKCIWCHLYTRNKGQVSVLSKMQWEKERERESGSRVRWQESGREKK